MANVTVTSISRSGTNTILKGKTVDGGRVTVENAGTELDHDVADNGGNWECEFPSAGNNTVIVKGAGKDVKVDVETGDVTYPDQHVETLQVQMAAQH
jgi:hypothetical protein